MATVSFTTQMQGITSIGLVALAIAVVRFIVEAANAVVRGNKELLSAAHQLFRKIIHRIREGLPAIGLAVKCFYYRFFKRPFFPSPISTFFADT